MTHQQRNEAIRDLIRDYGARHGRTQGEARQTLIDEGIYTAEGDLRPEFGGPGWEKRGR